ncbi:hypothetical protein BQ1740_2116 [Bacillus subtilis]|nr:hypothetical protein BQ1740_2116 [Bacillus subtilis]
MRREKSKTYIQEKIRRTGVDHLFQKVYLIWKGEMTIV